MKQCNESGIKNLSKETVYKFLFKSKYQNKVRSQKRTPKELKQKDKSFDTRNKENYQLCNNEYKSK